MKLTLKALRANYGITQKQAAKAIGVSTKTWFSYESGKTSPRTETVKSIGNLFNIDPDNILFCPHLQLNCNSSERKVSND